MGTIKLAFFFLHKPVVLNYENTNERNHTKEIKSAGHNWTIYGNKHKNWRAENTQKCILTTEQGFFTWKEQK